MVSRPGVPDPAQPGSLRPLTRLPARRTMANVERTFIAIKPDGVQRSLVGEIIKRFEQKGFRLVAMKLLQVTRPLSPAPSVAGSQVFFLPGRGSSRLFSESGSHFADVAPARIPLAFALSPEPSGPVTLSLGPGDRRPWEG